MQKYVWYNYKEGDTMKNKLETISNLFEESEIRSIWDSEKGDYYFSVVDVIKALTDSSRPRKYWSDLKVKLKQEGSQLSEKIGQLKMQASDGKFYNTDVLDTKGIFRLIESIPSPKAEPFKLWLANLGNERIEEVFDPEKAIANLGGKVANNTKKDIENILQKSIISSENKLNNNYSKEKQIN